MNKVIADLRLRRANRKLKQELQNKNKVIHEFTMDIAFKDSVISNKTNTILKQQRIINKLQGDENVKITNSK